MRINIWLVVMIVGLVGMVSAYGAQYDISVPIDLHGNEIKNGSANLSYGIFQENITLGGEEHTDIPSQTELDIHTGNDSIHFTWDEANNTYILQSDEGTLDVNSSDYWDNLNTESDLTPSNFLTAGNFLQYSGDSLYVDMAFSGLNDTSGSPSDGQGWCYNSTSGYFEPCSVASDGYLPDDPADVDLQGTYNITGVNEFRSGESVQNTPWLHQCFINLRINGIY